MKKLTVTILHKLHNRVRFKLSKDLILPKRFIKELKGSEYPSLELRYNRVNKTLLVTFSPDEILLQEVIYKIAIAYSIENGMLPVRLMEGNEYKDMSKLSIYAGAAISLSLIHKLIKNYDENLQNILNWTSLAITSAAVTEHAFIDRRRKGNIDFEVLPALYMIKSFLFQQNISSVAIMWLTTFGRHLITKKSLIKEVKVFRVKDKNGKGYHYIANIVDDNTVESLSDFIYQLFFKKANSNINTERYITLSDK